MLLIPALASVFSFSWIEALVTGIVSAIVAIVPRVIEWFTRRAMFVSASVTAYVLFVTSVYVLFSNLYSMLNVVVPDYVSSSLSLFMPSNMPVLVSVIVGARTVEIGISLKRRMIQNLFTRAY